jgi:hypothetical protein
MQLLFGNNKLYLDPDSDPDIEIISDPTVSVSTILASANRLPASLRIVHDQLVSTVHRD